MPNLLQREEEAAVARGGRRVIADAKGDTPPTDKRGRLPFERRARGEGEDGQQARRKRRLVEEQRAGGATGAPRPSNPIKKKSLPCLSWGI